MTELHAFKPISTAFEKARKLLLEPFDAGVWIKLVIITFFVGTGTMSFNPGNSLRYSLDRSDLGSLSSSNIGNLLSDTTIIIIVLVIILAAIILALLMSYLRGVFSFVLLNALTSGNVKIVQPFKENMGRGFKVFIFNIVVTVISLLIIGAIIAAMILVILWAVGSGNLSSSGTWDAMSTASLFALIAAVLVGVMAIVVCSIILGLVVGFFYDFAVPLMYFKNIGLKQSIGEVWSLVTRQPLEFFVYVIVRWVLEVGIAIVTGIIYLFVLAISVAVGIIIVVMMVKLAETSALLALPFALALIIGLLLLIIISAIISMPVQVYLRYYSLDFLKSFNPDYVNYTGRFA
jgi:hypothetical protein